MNNGKIMPVLMLDCGNTRIKWGVWQLNQLSSMGTLDYTQLSHTCFNHVLCQDAAIAAVVDPSRLDQVLECCARLSITPHLAISQASLGDVYNGYSQPQRLGVDRWLALIAAWQQLQQACVVVDAGTAITVDVLNATAQHLGGAILPGLDKMYHSLKQTGHIHLHQAGQLQILGQNTEDCLYTGLIAAATGGVIRLIEQAFTYHHLPHTTPILISGGDACYFLSALDGYVTLARPALVLQGLGVWWQQCKLFETNS